ncbi:MAG TPA: thiamine pyrophosphate-dependent enzyme, partial [Candidatus Binatia bacterium]|nr:thiamine pyrophosphate-dependent enzyme [Candidatus Binatia bacterium]
MSSRTRGRERINDIGLEYTDYKGRPSTLCQGCGHNSIASQIIQVAFELNLHPHEIVKLSGIGCSSKSPAYFLGMSHGFNALHGRMPSLGTGALMANHHLRAIGVSGDGDTGSIGMGQFKHLCRRNVRMVYIVENNGVYGLTKGQFSATADEGQTLKYAGTNEFRPIDLCQEAIVAGCGFVARSFSGDPTQVRELLKAALSHRGTAVIDIISPCVAFNNADDSHKGYTWGKQHEEPLHGLDYIPVREEIMIDDY